MEDTAFEKLYEDIQFLRITSNNKKPFSKQAYLYFQKKIKDYTNNLLNEADKIAEYDDLDSISISHVELASNNLKRNRKVKIIAELLNTLGGIFLGIALTSIFSSSGNNIDFSFFIKNLVCGIVGALFIMINYIVAHKN